MGPQDQGRESDQGMSHTPPSGSHCLDKHRAGREDYEQGRPQPATFSPLPTLQHSRKSAVSMVTVIPRVLPLPLLTHTSRTSKFGGEEGQGARC